MWKTHWAFGKGLGAGRVAEFSASSPCTSAMRSWAVLFEEGRDDGVGHEKDVFGVR